MFHMSTFSILSMTISFPIYNITNTSIVYYDCNKLSNLNTFDYDYGCCKNTNINCLDYICSNCNLKINKNSSTIGDCYSTEYGCCKDNLTYCKDLYCINCPENIKYNTKILERIERVDLYIDQVVDQLNFQ
jgi:hypothetical protein